MITGKYTRGAGAREPNYAKRHFKECGCVVRSDTEELAKLMKGDREQWQLKINMIVEENYS